MMFAGVSAAAFTYAAEGLFPGINASFGEVLLYGLQVGVTGGTATTLQGGDFGNGFLAAGMAALVLARLILAGYGWAAGRWIEGIDHYGVQAVGNAAVFVILLVASSLVVAAAPRRILLFDDHVRIKSRAWRSRILKADDIEEIAMERGGGAWLSRGILRSPPLAFGLIRPGIHLRPVKGRSYFFRSRDTVELAEVLGSWWGRPISQYPLKRRRKSKKAEDAPVGAPATPEARAPQAAPGATPARATSGATIPGVATGAAARGAALPPPPGPDDPEEDIDFDSIGLTEEEMRELLGEE